MHVTIFNTVLMKYDPPYFTTPPGDIMITEGETGVSHCEAQGKPAPYITWYKTLSGKKERQELVADEHIIVNTMKDLDAHETSSVLKYVDAVPEVYDGKYQVEAVNEGGKAVYDITVYGKCHCRSVLCRLCMIRESNK